MGDNLQTVHPFVLIKQPKTQRISKYVLRKYWIIRLYLSSIGKYSNPNNTSTAPTAQTDQNGTRVQIAPMENHEAPTPSKDLLDKWQQEAYRDYGCADAAYASVIENAAKWGYSQAMKQMYQKLQNLLDD